MKQCHVCSSECAEGTELCPVCGAELISADGEEVTLEATLENPVLAVSVEDVVTAEIYRDVLKENGIAFTCDSDEQASMKVLFGGGFIAEDIYVNETDLERAKELYKEVLNAEPSFDEDDFEDFDDTQNEE